MEEYREIFIFFDRNADGLISTEELGICLRSLGFLVSTIDILDLIKKIDPSIDFLKTPLIFLKIKLVKLKLGDFSKRLLWFKA